MEQQQILTLLDAGAILGARDLKTERVDIPEWGGAVIVRELSAGDREWFQNEAIHTETVVGADGVPVVHSTPKLVGLNGKLLARCLVNEDGKRLFDDQEAQLISQKSADAVERIVTVALRLSKMGRFGVKEAEKNSAAAPSAASSFGSPSVSGEQSPN